MELKEKGDYVEASEEPDQKLDLAEDKNKKEADTRFKKLGTIVALVILVAIVVIVLVFIPCQTGFRIVQYF